MSAVRIAAPTASADRRNSPRKRLDKAATLQIGKAGTIDVVVGDLTREGCRIEADAILPPGSRVKVGLCNMSPVAGRLVWRNRNHYGCAFDSPLPSGAITAAHLPRDRVNGTGTRSVKSSGLTTIALVGAAATLPWAALAVIFPLLGAR